MPTESYVSLPAENVSGPRLSTEARTINSVEVEQYQCTVGRMTKIHSNQLLRPNDVIPYTSGDAMTDADNLAMSFTNFARETTGGGVKIIGAVCSCSANETTKPDLRLWLVTTTAAGGVVSSSDNAPFTISDTDLANLVAFISFPTAGWISGTTGSGGSSVCVGRISARPAQAPFKIIGSFNSLYGLVLVNNSYVPTASEVFQFRLYVERS